MGFFDLFKKECKVIVSTPAPIIPVEIIDLRKAECPECHEKLKKVPGAKTKCPHCLKLMFVRTTPKTNTRVIVTQDEANLIDDEWAVINGTIGDVIEARYEHYAVKEQMKSDNGVEPSEYEITLVIYNKRLQEHYKNKDWGLYRCVRYEIGILLKRENKFKEGLFSFLEVAYIDLNGPNNMGGNYSQECLKLYPEFAPENSGDLPPGMLGELYGMINKLQIDKEEVKELFLQHNINVYSYLGMPLKPEECWPVVEKAIWND